MRSCLDEVNEQLFGSDEAVSDRKRIPTLSESRLFCI